jgi:hypothetical protein
LQNGKFFNRFLNISLCFYYYLKIKYIQKIYEVKKKNYLKIISQIENIRKKNNTSWMNILRIAFKYNPKATAKVMSKIYHDDKRIAVLVKKLT